MTAVHGADAMRLNGLVLDRLQAVSRLGPEAEALVLGMSQIQVHPAGTELVRDNAVLTPRFLVEGWAARVRWLPDGRRQIISFIIPGDGVGICARPQPLALAPVLALTEVITLDARTVAIALVGAKPPPGLAEAFHISASFEEAGLIDQVVRLGRQSAYERLAHLLLELRYRLSIVGLASRTAFSCPLTQEMLADATGLSIVHVNRTLQQMRRDDLLEFRSGEVELLKPALLESIADWRPAQPSAWTR